MRSNGIFTIHHYGIKVDSIGKPIYLIPFGDVHKESHLHDSHHWKKFLTWAKKKDRAYFLGVGDYSELSSSHLPTTDVANALPKTFVAVLNISQK